MEHIRKIRWYLFLFSIFLILFILINFQNKESNATSGSINLDLLCEGFLLYDGEGNINIPGSGPYSILCAYDHYQNYANFLIDEMFSYNYPPVISNAQYSFDLEQYYFLPLGVYAENPLDYFQNLFGISENNGWVITGDEEMQEWPLLPGLGGILKIARNSFVHQGDNIARETFKLLKETLLARLKQNADMLMAKFTDDLIDFFSHAIPQQGAWAAVCATLERATFATIYASCIEGIIHAEQADFFDNCAKKARYAAKEAKIACDSL